MSKVKKQSKSCLKYVFVLVDMCLEKVNQICQKCKTKDHRFGGATEKGSAKGEGWRL